MHPPEFVSEVRFVANFHLNMSDDFSKHIFYLFIYLFIFGCVGSSFLCEGFL